MVRRERSAPTCGQGAGSIEEPAGLSSFHRLVVAVATVFRGWRAIDLLRSDGLVDASRGRRSVVVFSSSLDSEA